MALKLERKPKERSLGPWDHWSSVPEYVPVKRADSQNVSIKVPVSLDTPGTGALCVNRFGSLLLHTPASYGPYYPADCSLTLEFTPEVP